MTKPKSRHRYRRFSLRTFLIVLALVCVWFGWQMNQSNRQRKAVAWVLQMGGGVTYDYEVDDEGHTIADPKPTSPEWLRDFYNQVVWVEFHGPQVSDLTPLENLNSLQQLYLFRTEVSDLTPLENLNNLEELDLHHTKVSDLTPLANLKSLVWLRVANSPVSDLTPLANLNILQQLYITDTQVSEEQITKLQQALPNCVIHK